VCQGIPPFLFLFCWFFYLKIHGTLQFSRENTVQHVSLLRQARYGEAPAIEVPLFSLLFKPRKKIASNGWRNPLAAPAAFFFFFSLAFPISREGTKE
jgi:hypothetical protein